MMLMMFLLLFGWLALTIASFIKPPRKSFSPRPNRLNLTYGLGWLKFETEAFNNFPTKLLDKLGVFYYPTTSQRFSNPKSFDDDDDSCNQSQRSYRRSSKFSNMKRFVLHIVYDLGSILSISSIFFALVVLLYLLFSLLSNIFYGASGFNSSQKISQVSMPRSNPFNASYDLVKRAMMPAIHSFDPTFTDHSSGTPIHKISRITPNPKPFVQLVIPGLTIPWNTLPIYLSALILSQTFHEAGHAFAAALHIKLMEIKKLRVATAGVCHNLVMALLSWLVWNGGCNLFDSSVGRFLWKDLNNNGVMVAHVKEESSIRMLLNPRDIIVQVDDMSVNAATFQPDAANSLSSIKRWNDYLSEINYSSKSAAGYSPQGWCYAKDKLHTFSLKCCESLNMKQEEIPASPGICFLERGSHEYENNQHCLLAEEMSTLMLNEGCATGSDCINNTICIQPTPDENLIRLQIHMYPTDTVKKLIYRGPGNLLLEDVSITNLIPRYEFMSPKLILTIHEFFSLLISLSLGLAFMNLLPLKSLDGSAICEAIVSFISAPALEDDYDLNINETNLDLTSIGHTRPLGNPHQSFTHQDLIFKEIKQSLLFRFLSFMLYCLLKSVSFFSSDSTHLINYHHQHQYRHLVQNSSDEFLLEYNNHLQKISSTIKRYFKFLQSITLWISCFIFVGLLIS